MTRGRPVGPSREGLDQPGASRQQGAVVCTSAMLNVVLFVLVLAAFHVLPRQATEGRKETTMKIGKDARDDVASRTLFRASTRTLTVFGGRSTCPLTGRPFLSLVLFGGEEKMVTHSVA